MLKFDKTFDLIIEDIIQSVTPEELKERQKIYYTKLVEPIFEELLSENKMVKNPDGTYDVNDDLFLANMDLPTLQCIPYKLNKVNGYFDCSYNNLTDLTGSPREVNKEFDCHNNKLTNLKGSPEIIHGYFNCSKNSLRDLEGCPKEVKGNFYIQDMKNISFNEEDVEKVCKVHGKIFV